MRDGIRKRRKKRLSNIQAVSLGGRGNGKRKRPGYREKRTKMQ